MDTIKRVINKTDKLGLLKPLLAAAAVITLVLSTFATISIVTKQSASAVESMTTTSEVNTTTNVSKDSLNGAGAQYGDVWTEHRARTTVTYPQNVRAGQTFNYTRCVHSVYLAETSGYEASIDRVSIGASSESFGQIYTQGSTTRNLEPLCRQYSATAPAAGSSSMSIPAATITSYGGVGYAGSCCPRWGLEWSYSTQDNTLNFNNVYTNPSAQDDNNILVEKGESRTISPLANDYGFTGGLGTQLGTPVSHAIPVQATKGTCTWDGNNITYVNNGTTGTDSCNYRINQDETDGLSPSNGTTTATINFVISTSPVAVDDSATTAENTIRTIDVLENDSDPDGDDISIDSVTPESGRGTASIVNNEVVFNPGTDFDHLAVGDETVTTLTYTIIDEWGFTHSASIEITVQGRYDDVEAFNDSYSVDADDELTIFDPRSNDFADDNQDFWVRSIDDTGVIGLADFTDESVTYDPDSEFDYLNDGESETVTFTYEISNDIFPGVFSEATITITVKGVNDAPRPDDDIVTTDEATPLLIEPLLNDSDIDTDDTFELESAELITDDGFITISGDTTTFDPDGDFFAVSEGSTREATIEYVVIDADGADAIGQITVIVTGLNASPTAEDDEAEVVDRKTPTIDVLENDSDPDSDDVLAITSVTSLEGKGSVVIDNGKIRWLVGDAFFSLAIGDELTHTFTYTISDGHGGTDEAEGIITLTRTISNDADIDGNGIPDWFEKDYEQESLERALENNGVGLDPLVLPDTLEQCPAANDLLEIVKGQLRAGKTIEVAGTRKWLPHSRVSYFVCSTPTLLKRVSATADGLAATDLVLPKNLKSGKHTLVGIGLDENGNLLVQSHSVRVQGRLAATGTNYTVSGLATAFILFFGGFIVVLWQDRKQTHSS